MSPARASPGSIRGDFPRPDPAAVRTLAALSAATLHEAIGRRGALPARIQPVAAGMRLCGPALPVFCPAGDNLFLHAAVEVARPGDVLVVDHEAAADDGPFGDILAAACLARGVAGLVIDGCVRDVAGLRVLGLPVFAIGPCIGGTTKTRLGTIGHPVRIGGVEIGPGDVALGDEDGVVVVPVGEIATAAVAAEARIAAEAELRAAIVAGALTLDLLGLRAQAAQGGD